MASEELRMQSNIALPKELETGGPHRAARPKLSKMLSDPHLKNRFELVRSVSSQVRSSEYHLTNACNIRCDGCWFFSLDFDRKTEEPSDIKRWKEFAREQAETGVTAALLIGGEPTLFPARVEAFQAQMQFVTISTNGLLPFPESGFEDVAVALSLFGGVGADDKLRAIRPSGSKFEGLFDTALANYRGDPRATFIYALDVKSPHLIRETVDRISENGNLVSYNYYSDYGHAASPADRGAEQVLLEEALLVAEDFPGVVLSHPYYTQALITGRTAWGRFGYESCPSISVDHPDHEERLKNGKPTLTGFNAYTADTKQLAFCCTSGSCETCRDSQAVHSWLMTNIREFMRADDLRTWVEISESYWSQFVWSPFHEKRATANLAQ